MSEPLPEPTPPSTLHAPPDAAAAELARKNMRWAWALFGLFWVLFGGTILVALIYLWLS